MDSNTKREEFINLTIWVGTAIGLFLIPWERLLS